MQCRNEENRMGYDGSIEDRKKILISRLSSQLAQASYRDAYD